MPSTDEVAISDLLAQYNVVTDALDINGWAACFTPDGVFNGAYDTFRLPEDKERFAEHARELEAAGMPRMRHFLSNVRIRVHGDTATSHCFFQIVATDNDAHSTIAMVGEYADELVKLDGRWLFAVRNVTVDGRQSAA
ncbi:nuclear transport factor 2 family protein [Streptomyces sp. NPDC001982]|uniref:nuclear transport factor 2 family protein n=1 Tax=Streptomyces sp. NPDC001982 TaxID=3154405 RepID=UPI00332894D0